MSDIRVPVIIICYNNGHFVKNTINQLKNVPGIEKFVIIDNKSTDRETRIYLKEALLDPMIQVICMDSNYGHLVFYRDDIFDSLPKHFIVTDPDLEYNKDMPQTVISDLVSLSNDYEKFKIGLALDISDHDEFYQTEYFDSYSIYETELKYWSKRISDPNFILYEACIDTTFALYNKDFFISKEENATSKYIRIAGDYTAKHLPWYISYNSQLSLRKLLTLYCSSDVSFTSKPIQKHHIPDNIHIVRKNKSSFLVYLDTDTNGGQSQDDHSNANFWKNIYSGWEPETFDIFDQYCSRDKNILDIGAWIGTTVLYQVDKVNHVYCVEADIKSIKELTSNIELNDFSEYCTVIPKAVYSTTGYVTFGPNPSWPTLNQSTSMIKKLRDIFDDNEVNEGNNDYQSPAISFEDMIREYGITNLSLIKCDIEGGEEHIMIQMLEYVLQHNIACYLSFHYAWWQDLNIERFESLFLKFKDGDSITSKVKSSPFDSILFVPL
jgi:FkbM family methyltransferase